MKHKKLIVVCSIITLLHVTHSTVPHEINITEKPTQQFIHYLAKFNPKIQEKIVVIQDAIIFLLNLQPITLISPADHAHAINSVAIHGDMVITGSYDNTVKIWNIHTGELLHTLAVDDDGIRITAVAVSGNPRRAGKIVAGLSNNTIKIWDIDIEEISNTNKTNNAIKISSAPLTLVCGDPAYKITSIALDNDTLVTGSHDGTVKIWDIDTKELLKVFTYNAPVNAVAIDNGKVVAGGWDDTAKIWNIHTGTLLHILTGLEGHASAITSVAIRKNRVITGSYDKTAKIWNAETGQCLFTLAGKNRHTDGITSVAINGDEVVTGSLDGSAKVWDAHTGEFILTLAGPDGHTGPVNAVAIQDNTIVTGSSDCTAKIWPLELTLQEASEDNPLVWIIQNRY